MHVFYGSYYIHLLNELSLVCSWLILLLLNTESYRDKI